MGIGQSGMDDGYVWPIEAAAVDLRGFSDGDRPISDYRDLDVWNVSMSLATEIYRATHGFPREELYGLTSQLRRASVSVPANIAEGYGRASSGNYVHFLKIALGSAREIETLIEISARLTFLKKDDEQALAAQTVRISKMLWSLIRSIEARRR